MCMEGCLRLWDAHYFVFICAWKAFASLYFTPIYCVLHVWMALATFIYCIFPCLEGSRRLHKIDTEHNSKDNGNVNKNEEENDKINNRNHFA